MWSGWVRSSRNLRGDALASFQIEAQLRGRGAVGSAWLIDVPKRCQPSPSMPEQELLDDFLEALEAAGSPVRNPVPRETLGWPEAQYEEVKAERSFCVPWLS